MKKKPVLLTELSYALGMVTLGVGTALMARADFGMSMVVAPAYLLHLKLSPALPFYTFGMSEYVFQAVILLLLTLVMRRFKQGYLFSFVTAVIYGFTLDACIWLTNPLPCPGMAGRVVFYVIGLLLCALGVSFFFHTSIAPEAYELFVKEVSGRTGKPLPVVKTAYDCTSCALAVVMSFAFFGFGVFEGVKLGTVLCALVNGFLIGQFNAWLEAHFEFKDALKYAK